MEYRVQLPVYDGPLDLLLYLLRRDELDIHDIPITRITETYMTYVELLRKDASLDINLAGEFLVMAATLMEIKSATLLPKAPVDEQAASSGAAAELQDPRADLIRQLLEYKRFKDTARLLEQKQADHAQRFARNPAALPGESPDEPPPLDMEEVQIWDLLDAFSKLMREVGTRGPREHEVTYDDTPLDLHAADIEDRLRRQGRLTLRELIIGRATRSEMIGVFLAILEMVRSQRIALGHIDEANGEGGGDIELLPPSKAAAPGAAPAEDAGGADQAPPTDAPSAEIL